MPENEVPMTADDLSGFIGSTQLFRHGLFKHFTYTDGVQFVGERAGAYWLIDAIFSHQISKAANREEFQVWTLTRTDKGGASLVMTDGNSERAIIRQDMEFTTFPMETISLYFCNNVLMLPSEY